MPQTERVAWASPWTPGFRAAGRRSFRATAKRLVARKKRSGIRARACALPRTRTVVATYAHTGLRRDRNGQAGAQIHRIAAGSGIGVSAGIAAADLCIELQQGADVVR